MIGDIAETAVSEPRPITETSQETEGKPSEYSVRIELFKGPMDLLLYLIEKDELDIYNISIIDITRQYLEYIEIMRLLDINAAGEFMVMAARLMQIKARMLLPVAEEDEEEIDLRSELIQALVEYKRIKKAAEIMSDMESLSRLRFNTKIGHNDHHETPYMELEVNLFDLLRAFREVSTREHEGESIYDVESIKLTVEDRIEYLLSYITPEGIRFNDIFRPGDARIVLIVTFIAMLELVRLRRLSIRQNSSFGDIWIYLK